LTAVCLLACAPAAHAKPSFSVVESSARAADVVHFSLSGADGSSYVIEVDGTRVASGVAAGVVTVAFTVPDLGGQPWTVPVGASIRASGSTTRLQAGFAYMGHALPPPPEAKPAPPPVVAPVAPQSSAPAPAAIPAPSAVKGGSPAPAPSPPRKRGHPRRKGREAPTAGARSRSPHHREGRRPARTHGRRGHGASSGKRHHERSRHRGALWPAGSLESGRSSSGSASDPAPPKPAAPRPAIAVAAHPRGGGTSRTALAIPALLALAGLALAATTLMRRRELASRRLRG
jgi:hypothetical protein